MAYCATLQQMNAVLDETVPGRDKRELIGKVEIRVITERSLPRLTIQLIESALLVGGVGEKSRQSDFRREREVLGFFRNFCGVERFPRIFAGWSNGEASRLGTSG